MKKPWSVFMFTLLLFSCTTISVRPTANLIAENSYESTMAMIHENAMKCWSKEYDFWSGDAFLVEKKSFNENAGMVTVRRSAPDIAYQSAFTLVVVRRFEEKSKVEISEGSCAYNCDMDLTSDVERWINGDHSCKKQES